MIRSLAMRAYVQAIVLSAIFIVLFGALAVSTRQTREAVQWVDHTQTVITALDQATVALRTAESVQRGFVISRDAAFADSFGRQIEHARQSAALLVQLTADNPDQNARARALQRLFDQRTRWLSKNYDLALQGNFETAGNGISSRKGLTLMQSIEDLDGRIRQEERNLMAKRAGYLDQLTVVTRWLVFFGGPVVLAVVIVSSIAFARNVRKPAQDILDAMQRLAAGEEDVLVRADFGSSEFNQLALGYDAMAERLRDDAVFRREAERNLQATNAELAASAAAAAARGAAIERLAGMAHRMQAARNDQEMAMIIACFVPQVLPGSAGLLYAFNNSRNQLTAIAAWGGQTITQGAIPPESCWALRRGQSHSVAATGQDIVCAHVAEAEVPYHCEPLLAGGDVIGLLQLDGVVAEEELFMLNALGENIASALVNHRLQHGLREQTIRDPLTGLFNRRYMEESLATEVARVARSKAPLGMVMCDVDHFKRFNDEFGHNGGDAVLQAVAAEMVRHFRDGDVVCRYGGEEFAIIAPNAPVEVLAERVEVLREAISRLRVRDGNTALGTVNMSFGVAGWEPEMGLDSAKLLVLADAALYRAKNEGRNRTVVELRKSA